MRAIYKSSLLTLVVLLLVLQSKADQWEDPSWQEMLEKSTEVALIKYCTPGNFQARAVVIRNYKGNVQQGDSIWVSGFSNRYGPVDQMKPGDTYVVFLNLRKPSTDETDRWNKELKNKVGSGSYDEALINGKAYYVWTPTCGDLRVSGNRVQYDLMQTSFYPQQSFYPLSAFEKFMAAYYHPAEKEIFDKSLLSALPLQKAAAAQSLMMLQLLGYNKYEPVFARFVSSGDIATRVALATLLGGIRNGASRSLLLQLLKDKNSFVQGEAVRQLSNEPAAFIGPVLLASLKGAGEQNFGPSNIMDPVLNTIDGGKVQIIKTLGKLQYRPAIKELLPLLKTNDPELFKLVIQTLRAMGSRDYASYLNFHLQKQTRKLIYDICRIIRDDSLTECLPALMQFISTHDRNYHPSSEVAISTCCGIGYFKDTAVRAFLLADFKRFFSYKDTLDSRKQGTWFKEYIETFTNLHVADARPLIYDAVFDWYGINEDFAKNPGLFKVKEQLEDSLKKVFTSTFTDTAQFRMTNCIAFLKNTGDVIAGMRVNADFLVEVEVKPMDKYVEYRDTIGKVLNMSPRNVYIRFDQFSYSISQQVRFDKKRFYNPFIQLVEYAKEIPNKDDLMFLKMLQERKFFTDAVDERHLKKAIIEIESKL